LKSSRGWSGLKPTPLFFGWWIAAAGGINLGYISGVFVWSRSAFFLPIANEFQWNATTTSLALAIPAISGFFLPALTGFLIVRYGVRKVLFIGVMLVGVGLILTAYSFSFESFVIYMTIAQAGSSIAMVAPASAAIINWFDKKRGRALSVMWTGSSLGGWALPPLFVWYIAKTDWRDGMILAGVAALIICIPLSLVMRTKPESHGYLPDGVKTSQEQNDGANNVVSGPMVTPKQAMKERTFWFLCLIWALFMLSFGALGYHQIPYFEEELGIRAQTAAYVISAASILALAGRWIFGYLADVWDQRFSMAIMGIFQSISMFVLALLSMIANPSWHIWLFPLLYGPSYGGMMPVITTFIGARFGRKNYASIQGLTLIAGTSMLFLGPVVVGLVVDATGSRMPVFFGIAIALLVMPLAALMIPKKSKFDK